MSSLIFASRWLQLPLYLGLILAQCVYVFLFGKELWHLLSHSVSMGEQQIMLIVLGLIDVVMISNLLVMVIVGGYETFVSRLRLEGHPDQPEWLSHVNASVLKVKLAMAIIGISSIHLLKTFIATSALKGLPLCKPEQWAAAVSSASTSFSQRWRRYLHDHDPGRRAVADHHPLRVHPVGDRHRLDRQADVQQPQQVPRQVARPLRSLPAAA